MTLLSELQYPHWLMVAGVVLVVLGFIGFVFPRKRNIESDHGPTVNGK
jgi:LPXTG-motif cell wall-anchored protein